MANQNLIITIEREYGSGGRIVGKKLSQELGLHFYDDDLIRLASEKSAVGEQYFRLADEKAGNNLLHKLGGGRPVDIFSEPSPDRKLTTPENLFKFQSLVIRELAEQEPCVFVGRAAGYVLDQYEEIERLVRISSMPTRSRRCSALWRPPMAGAATLSAQYRASCWQLTTARNWRRATT